MIDFGGGCSCCCSFCCDRGKIKSTPSPKTEVGTLDWSLTTKSKAFGSLNWRKDKSLVEFVKLEKVRVY